ncbi:DUF4232 domain-containing protein [Streptomyces antibioticus]|nr:DUF4232 domain-containing protein [Streptomyces antibioticus]MCX4738551.1 DUF4232 domain-containing protein [Streptomyces antibioticus]
MRRTLVTMAAVAVAAVGTAGCQPGDSEVGAGGEPGASGSTTSTPGTPSAPSTSETPGTDTSGPSAAKCAADALEVAARQAAERPQGTGTGAAVVTFTNVSGTPCVLEGHPSVAGAGNGSPEHNSPLAVTPSGSAAPVTVAAGGKAWVKLTFVQVQGEGDGYCASGADPVTYPTLVVGLPGSGAHQVALDDGVFAECDNTVTVTAVSATEPA